MNDRNPRLAIRKIFVKIFRLVVVLLTNFISFSFGIFVVDLVDVCLF